MRTALMVRHSHEPKQELGVISLLKLDGDIFVAKTLERPDLNNDGIIGNEKNASCIPAGTYLCKYTRSNRLSSAAKRDYFTYEVLHVQGRTGIRIHPFNYWFQGLGCIAMGSGIKDINLDNINDVIHTGETIAAFEKELQYKNFLLQIMAI